MGFCNTTYLVSVQAAAALRERGAATASNMFMRIVGQSVGAALFGALVNIGLTRHGAPGDVAERLMAPLLRQASARPRSRRSPRRWRRRSATFTSWGR